MHIVVLDAHVVPQRWVHRVQRTMCGMHVAPSVIAQEGPAKPPALVFTCPMTPKERLLQLIADYLEVEAMIAALHSATSPAERAAWAPVARRAAADLACAAPDAGDALTPWRAWRVLASVLARFGCEVALQLREHHTVDPTGDLTCARITIADLCQQIHRDQPRG